MIFFGTVTHVLLLNASADFDVLSEAIMPLQIFTEKVFPRAHATKHAITCRKVSMAHIRRAHTCSVMGSLDPVGLSPP